MNVTWSPPTNVRRYVVTYRNGSDTNSISVDNPAAVNATVSGLLVNVNYTITVQAYGNLPGPVSNPQTITLQGMKLKSL